MSDLATDGDRAAPGGGEGGSIYAWYVVVVLAGAMAFSLVDRFALSLLFGPIKADLGLSDTKLGLLHGVAFGLFYAALGMPLAQLVDTRSRKAVILGGIAVWSAATAACGFSRSFGSLLAARIGVGAGEAALAPAGYSIITDTMPNRLLGTAISVFQMGSLFGAGLALLAGGAVYGAMQQVAPISAPILQGLSAWQLTFIALAAPGLPFLILLSFIREPKRRHLVRGADPTTSGQPTIWAYVRASWPLLIGLFLGCGSLVGISYAMISWGPAVLGREYGWHVEQIGFRLGLLFLTVAPAGVLVGGLIADRWRRKISELAFAKLLLTAALAVSFPVLSLFWIRTPSALFAAIAATQFITSLMIGVGPAATQALAPPHLRGRVSAVYVFTVNLMGLGLGPVAIGALSDAFPMHAHSLQNSIAVFSLAMTLSAIVFLTLFRRELVSARKRP